MRGGDGGAAAGTPSPQSLTYAHGHTLTHSPSARHRIDEWRLERRARTHGATAAASVALFVVAEMREGEAFLGCLRGRAGAGGRVEAGAWTDGGCMHDAAHSLHLFGVAPLTSHGGRVT